MGHAFATTILITFLWIAITTVALSFFAALSYWPVLIIWLAPCIALLTQTHRIRRSVAYLYARIRSIASNQPVAFWTIFSVFTLFITGAFLSAVLYPVSNGDSLFAHIPRIFFAIQTQSIAPYPTSVIEQVISYPLASWTLTQVTILNHNAYWAVNLVQWMCYPASVILCLLIARKMKATIWGQAFAVIAALTVTGAILQASTTQYDLVFSVPLLVAIYFGLCFISATDSSKKNAFVCLLGTALGVALLAKITIVPLFLPFSLWLIYVSLKKNGLLITCKRVAVAILLALIIASPWLIRNEVVFNGDILLSKQAETVSIPNKTPGPMWANMWRAFFTEFSTPIPAANQVFEHVAGMIGGALGTPLTSTVDTEYGMYHFTLFENANIHHDRQASPFSWWLILLSTVTILVMRKPSNATRVYALCSICGFLLTGTLITWQPFLGRTLTPALLVGAPLVGVVMGEIMTRASVWARIFRVVFALLLAGSLLLGGLALFYNRTNPLLPDEWLGLPKPYAYGWWDTPREQLSYVVTTPTLEPAVSKLRAYIHEHDPQVILFIGDRLHGPAWPLLQLFKPPATVGQAGVGIAPATRLFTNNTLTRMPDLIISEESQPPHQDSMEYKGTEFVRNDTVYTAARPDYGQPEQWITLWSR